MKKFDVVIGNPPYQEDAQGNATNQMPIYHLFMDAAFEVGKKAVLITPARFLFDAGYTPKVWNAKMLSDRHLSVPIYVPNSDKLFPGTDIKGGVAVSYRDDSKTIGPIVKFMKYPELATIDSKVADQRGASMIEEGITNDRVFRYSHTMHEEYPDLSSAMSAGNHYKIDSRAFSRLHQVFFVDRPDDGHDYLCVLGLDEDKKRAFRWIRKDFVAGPEVLYRFKVALPKASGSGVFGETLAPPLILGPGMAVTGTFITVGSFSTVMQAEACLKYIKTKFSRAMLGMKKVTQDNLARVWAHVPTQDFTSRSDVDWSKSIAEIDQQLYAKYNLSADEIEFIEEHVQPMS
ncbi:MAG: Eco57I restriction-modification methylase domain-containing protein [Thermomicrobiales bacterium]|nr:Eco57I restriction-modification methylase domain-containing protein [Thermomicrobiales bacterium]